MDGRASSSGKDGGQGNYIWLRYATQFSAGGRTHTIEMGIPMPLGASAQVREELLREAEAGLDQLASHIENRVTRVVQQTQPSQAPATASTPIPSTRPSPAQKPPARPASVPAPQTTVHPSPPSEQEKDRENRGSTVTAMVPPTRPNIGASMPLSPISGDSSGNIPLPEFLQFIKENLKLDPKQAMQLLKVRSLSDINRREALDQLQRMIAQGATPPKVPASTGDTRSPQATGSSHTPEGTPADDSASPTPILLERPRAASNTPADRDAPATAREQRPIYIFDEEVGPDEDDELSDLDDLDLPRELTPQEQSRAEDVLSRLREARGATTASSSRLQALNNVVGSQLSPEQLQALIEGIWNVTTVKKLKVDQTEALISWAKEDDFINEAEAILTLLEEEHYARGNR